VGERLGVGAHLVTLRRLGSGRFSTEEARSLEEVRELCDAGRLGEALLSPAESVADYPAVVLDEGRATALRHGRPLPPTGKDGPVAALDPSGRSSPWSPTRAAPRAPSSCSPPRGVDDG
jgi:tRNA pseudouridine55 synthase